MAHGAPFAFLRACSALLVAAHEYLWRKIENYKAAADILRASKHGRTLGRCCEQTWAHCPTCKLAADDGRYVQVSLAMMGPSKHEDTRLRVPA